MADHILADGQDFLVVGIEFEELRPAGQVALEHPEIALGVDTHRRHAAVGAIGAQDHGNAAAARGDDRDAVLRQPGDEIELQHPARNG
ncbi:hypothetical protein D3C83_82850 [compost metagenome]